MTFTAKIKDSKVVKGIFEAVSSIITETFLDIDPEKGISMVAMDLSHICLVSLVLAKEDLDEFKADDKLKIAINLEDFVKIVKRANPQDEIVFKDDPEAKRFIIEMKPETAKKARRFTISMIDIDEEKIGPEALEQLEFYNQTTFKLSYLDEAIKDAEIFSDALEIIADKNLSFSTTGNIGDMTYELEKDELESSDFTQKSEGIFGIQFLKNILKISAVSSKVEMYMATELPIKMVFDILNSSRIVYYLAPRTENEDEENEDELYED
ncbi:MAG: proliferating cell nuclear antigen (pcna) [Promethearchaeota archaeon]